MNQLYQTILSLSRLMIMNSQLFLSFAAYGESISNATKLSRLNEQPVAAGTLVYRGNTYPLDADDDEPLFQYERHVLSSEGDLIAIHRTYDRQSKLMQSEAVWTSSSYEVRHVALMDLQSAVHGIATVNSAAGTLSFSVFKDGRERQKTEPLLLPLVSGPSLFGYIYYHWDAVVSSDRHRVSLIVLNDLTTYGFTIRAEGVKDGLMVFSVTPTNLLVRLAVPQMRVSFDAQTRQLVGFEGRVPPQDNRTNKLRALDARVEYQVMLPTYQ